MQHWRRNSAAVVGGGFLGGEDPGKEKVALRDY